MRRAITVAALVAALFVPAVASAFHQGQVVIGRYRLPQNHRFETTNAQGKYQVVDINQVPGLIDRGQFVFDRTANTWINHPNGSPINTAYLASGASATAAAPSTSTPSSSTNQGGWQKIHGSVQSVSGSTLTLRTDDGRQLSVDMGKVSPEIQQSLRGGEGVTVSAYQMSGNNVTAEYIQKDSSSGVSASPATK